ncbi:hypothetical protein BT63DRAFT_427762 [Microthyrium microscopicum]|uniref:C2H2-type domain-containing protein n=1 Tax=Microthyrium microscopicum TaxID=703497 RepID=A0A6A6U4U7_9PEZI|nr:hypothetical protein BT63DRAFT_427762 [Microthyrium microscopicum]
MDALPLMPAKRSLEPEDTLDFSSSKRSKFAAADPPTPPQTLSPSTPNRTNNDPRPRIYDCHYPPCTASFTRPCRLAEHERSHTGERPYLCPRPDCGKTFSRDYHLSRHLTFSHTDARIHACTWPGCGKAFATTQRKREHEKTHERKRQFACVGHDPSCTETFRKKSTLATHIAKVHLGIKPFPCTENDDEGAPCTAAYETQGKLNEHMRKRHSGPRYFCTLCEDPAADAEPGVAEDEDTAMGGFTLPKNPLGFTTMPALLAHKREAHPKQPKPRGRPRKPVDPNVFGRVRAANNQHTKGRTARPRIADELLGVAPEAEASIACLRSGCDHRFTNSTELEEHCMEKHGMARIEVAEAEREREALSGGVFWMGGVEPEYEEYGYGSPFGNVHSGVGVYEDDEEDEVLFGNGFGAGVGTAMDMSEDFIDPALGMQ